MGVEAADVEEVERLLRGCSRPLVRSKLEALAGELRAQVPREPVPAEKPAADKPATPAQKEAPSAETAPAPAPVVVTGGPWTEFPSYSFEAGSYGSEKVTVSVRLKGIGELPREQITCTFGKSQFDLRIMGWEGKNWRMFKTNLEKEVDTSKCSFKVTKNSVYVYLAKVKGEYGYESWADLVSKKSKKDGEKSSDPTAGLMDLMRDMYNDGDDTTKKAIGEAMMKARTGEGKDDMGMPKFDD